MKTQGGFLFAWVVLGGALCGQAEEPLVRIAFGSCYKPEKKTELWTAVKAFDPQLWLWLGDNFYHDWAKGKYLRSNDDPKCFATGYEELGASEGVRALQGLARDHVMATWDDHDFGKNDAGKDYARKEESRLAFVKFWGAPDRVDGIYSARDFGPVGQRVRVILLDTRFNRDALPRKGEAPSEGDILGERQWSWLEEEISRPGASLVLIGSSIQFLAEEHRFEKWANFPKAKKRMWQLLRSRPAGGVLFLSGDRHHGEISCFSESPLGYPLYEITSSGLTEGGGIGQESNRNRVGQLWNANNFGAIRIDWSQANPKISLEIRDQENQVVREVAVASSQLAPPKR